TRVPTLEQRRVAPDQACRRARSRFGAVRQLPRVRAAPDLGPRGRAHRIVGGGGSHRGRDRGCVPPGDPGRRRHRAVLRPRPPRRARRPGCCVGRHLASGPRRRRGGAFGHAWPAGGGPPAGIVWRTTMTVTARRPSTLMELFRPQWMRDPYALYRELRERQPMYWDQPMQSWVVLSYAE